MLLKMWGLQRTCTNVVAWLLEHNLDVEVEHGVGDRWKHGPAKDLPDVSGHIVCVKNPFAWVVSMRAYVSMPLPGLLSLWNVGNQQYLEFLRDASGSPRLLVTHEAIVDDWQSVVFAAADRFRAKRRRDPFRGQPLAMWRGGGVGESYRWVTDEEFDATRYREGKYMAALSSDDIEFIAANADPVLCRAMGYPVEVK